MKTIVLTRHAKSSWEHDVIDRERPLKKRGFNDAELVSQSFKERLIIPDAVFSSPANRALTTCKIFMKNLKIEAKCLSIIEDLYDFGGQNVMEFIKSMNEDYKTVMIFGHNHAFTSICNIFGDIYIDNLPTSGLAVIDFEVDSWSQVGRGSTRFTIFPRDLK